MSLGIVLFVVASVLALNGKSTLSDILFGVSSLFGIGALALMIYNLSISSKFASSDNAQNKPKVVVKIVDVKDLPKSKEEKLYEQYEGLYKQGLITKEDLDKKKEELLKK